jgi:hypothetical protein
MQLLEVCARLSAKTSLLNVVLSFTSLDDTATHRLSTQQQPFPYPASQQLSLRSGLPDHG